MCVFFIGVHRVGNTPAADDTATGKEKRLYISPVEITQQFTASCCWAHESRWSGDVCGIRGKWP